MAKISHFLIIALVFTVVTMVAETEACEMTLYPTNCIVQDCQNKCLEKSPTFTGQCH
ncbi:hypothetical protein ES319_A09G246200v1 [Gossypium barbadense]|uniref:Uncharacterized protein n=2 Tax=Gossypium TaxID=3633 RepID=A0A5J5UJM8_GOSBA|nr:hypothetical protein ES319_A09G246200v1 [Gossypium barbadense]TYH04084.1 hypothetical protein ES288_A09G271500v1 [Gossypium darwinii]